MTERMQKIDRFLRICTELADGKYAQAGAKITEALAAIASSPDLTELFTAVTQNFDYASAKRNFLRLPAQGTARGAAYLPAERSDLLAFVFCLFVDLDSGVLQLGELLSRYFYVDGSYTAAYTLFARRVVKPFRDIVADCYPALRIKKDGREDAFEQFSALIPLEQARIFSLALGEADKAAATLIFGGLSASAMRREGDTVKAILAGYRYFLHAVGAENELAARLFDLAAAL